MMYNVIGTIGVAIILTTYFLLQTNRIHANELPYSVLNFFGASMILISLIYDFNFPSFVVEVAWVLISVMGMIRWWLKQNKTPQS
ncbi:MAG: hypothetical protein WBC91_25010 [Phototrophicaceae bacterium]